MNDLLKRSTIQSTQTFDLRLMESMLRVKDQWKQRVNNKIKTKKLLKRSTVDCE